MFGALVGMGIGLVKKAITSKGAKKIAKKAITAISSGGGTAAIIGGGALAFPKFPGFGGDFGKVGKGIFGSSKGRIAAGEMGACPSGYHLNKHQLTDGTAPRTVCVRNRSTNYANGRAARRAGRRLRGTVKMLSRSFTFVSAKPKGRPIVRK